MGMAEWKGRWGDGEGNWSGAQSVCTCNEAEALLSQLRVRKRRLLKSPLFHDGSEVPFRRLRVRVRGVVATHASTNLSHFYTFLVYSSSSSAYRQPSIELVCTAGTLLVQHASYALSSSSSAIQSSWTGRRTLIRRKQSCVACTSEPHYHTISANTSASYPASGATCLSASVLPGARTRIHEGLPLRWCSEANEHYSDEGCWYGRRSHRLLYAVRRLLRLGRGRGDCAPVSSFHFSDRPLRPASHLGRSPPQRVITSTSIHCKEQRIRSWRQR